MKKSYKAPEIQTYTFEMRGALLEESNIAISQEGYGGKFGAREFAFDEEYEDEEVW